MLWERSFSTLVLLGALASAAAAAQPTAPGRYKKKAPSKEPFIFQESSTPPPPIQARQPKAPAKFNPDPGSWDKPVDETPRKGATATTPVAAPSTPTPAVAPAPAASAPAATGMNAPLLQAAPLPSGQLAPSMSILFPTEPILLPQEQRFAGEPVPSGLALPRPGVRGRGVIDERFHYRHYGHSGDHAEPAPGGPLVDTNLMPYSKAWENRWQISVPPYSRYADRYTETPYQYTQPELWHPYRQSILKGDVPIYGQEIFLNLIAKNFTLFEARRTPTPSGVSAARPNSAEFFGRSEAIFLNNDTSITMEFFKGETAFKPVNWSLRMTGVFNNNHLWVKENGLVDPDPRGSDYVEIKKGPNTRDLQAFQPDQKSLNPRGGFPAPFKNNIDPGDAFNYLAPKLQPLGDAKPLRKVDPETNRPRVDKKTAKKRDNDFDNTRYTRRHKEFFALQEAFFEIHLADLSNNYDFISSRSGIQPFISDFRGFVFSDTNLGFRVFGNLDNNRVQYNLAYFDMLEKDTYSDLNRFDDRDQQVLIANVYRQDFIVKGYTTQFSFHANWDNGEVHYDKNGFLTRPAPFGTTRTVDGRAVDGLQDHRVNAYYLGWTGDGHIGRLNITHAFYQVFGEDSFNELAGRRVDINAQMGALELSYDRDWLRLKLSGFYASGDDDPTDRTARGFDSIIDSPFFIGGPFSWYSHQGFNLAGTPVGLKTRDSLLTNMRTAKFEGQSNFVNPGVMILGVGADADVTPKLKVFANANYIWLAETQPIEQAIFSNKISNEMGWDLSCGFKWRPLLTDNVIIQGGVGFFLPGAGYESIYRQSTNRVRGLGPQDDAGKVDDFLYNAFLTVTLVY